MYEVLVDFMRFSQEHSFERDHDVRTEIVAHAIQMLDGVYELFAMKEMDPTAYEKVNRIVLTLCSGVPAGFSFLAQAHAKFGVDNMGNEGDDDEDAGTGDDEPSDDGEEKQDLPSRGTMRKGQADDSSSDDDESLDF